MTLKVGKVYLVGAGPGNPDLITVKGLDCLGHADVVVYDCPANTQLLRAAPATAETFSVGLANDCDCQSQEEINVLLVKKARTGKTVVRLKKGEPLFSAHGAEDVQHLAHAAIPYEIVPGVTAELGASAYAGIPLTYCNSSASLGFTTVYLNSAQNLGHVNWDCLAKNAGTIVFYMGISDFAEITRRLVSSGLDEQTPVAVIQKVSLPDQKVLIGTLTDIDAKVVAQDFMPPAVVIIGHVVKLRDELTWFDRRPLFGRKILVTRAAEQADSLVKSLGDLGAIPILCPTIKIVPPPSYSDLDAALNALNEFDFLILTSANAVEAFFKRLYDSGQDSRSLSGLSVVAVGPKTAKSLGSYGIKADLIPTDFRAEGVVTLLKDHVAGKRILYPKAALARDLIPQNLTAAGANVAQPVVYTSQAPPEIADALKNFLYGGLDLLTFSASSTVRNFADLVGPNGMAKARTIPVASIGPLTTKTCQDLGFNVAVEPKDSTLESLIDAIVKYYSKLKSDQHA